MTDDAKQPEPENPQGRDLSVPIEEIGTEALGMSVLLIAVPIAVYWLTWGGVGFRGGNVLNIVGLIIALVFAHEGVHALGWKIWGGLAWSDLEFGFAWRALAPYCHATAPMRADAYRFGAALPGVVTGVLPYLFGLLTADWLWALSGAILISGAVGDIYVLWLIRELPPDAVVKDHPSNAGCIVVDEGTPE